MGRVMVVVLMMVVLKMTCAFFQAQLAYSEVRRAVVQIAQGLQCCLCCTLPAIWDSTLLLSTFSRLQVCFSCLQGNVTCPAVALHWLRDVSVTPSQKTHVRHTSSVGASQLHSWQRSHDMHDLSCCFARTAFHRQSWQACKSNWYLVNKRLKGIQVV